MRPKREQRKFDKLLLASPPPLTELRRGIERQTVRCGNKNIYSNRFENQNKFQVLGGTCDGIAFKVIVVTQVVYNQFTKLHYSGYSVARDYSEKRERGRERLFK